MKRFASIVLALVMVLALTVSVAAKGSPTGKDYYSITTSAIPSDGSLGGASSDKNKVDTSIVKTDDGLVILTATEKNGKFDHWEITGDYEIVEGSLSSLVLKIRPLSDVKAVAVFKDSGSKSTPDTPTKPNDSGTSPKTGDPLLLVIGLAVLALGAGAFAVKKIKE